MKHFIYHVKDDSGRSLYGLMDAVNKRDVQKKISKTEFFFISAAPFNKKLLLRKRVKFQTLIMFTHRLTSLIEAGVPILTAMNILWKQSEDKTIQLVVSHMRSQLEEGNQISVAMDDFPNMFPKVYRALILVGEKSGALVPVLKRLSEYLDYQAAMIARTKKALLYPTIVVGFSFVVVMGMFMFVVPIFQKLLVRMRVELPFLTKMILALSETLRNPVFLLSAMTLITILIVLYRVFKNRRGFAVAVDKMKLQIPYFSNILKTLLLSQFVRSLAILLEAGVTVLESIDVSSSTVNNAKIKADLDKLRFDIEQGASLYEGFKGNKDFPVMLVEMVGVGETSGMIVPVLLKVTQHFDEEVDYHLNKFLTILEPALIVVVGLVVILTLLSIYLPVISIWKGLT